VGRTAGAGSKAGTGVLVLKRWQVTVRTGLPVWVISTYLIGDISGRSPQRRNAVAAAV
jgi:hypothetical protein